VPNGSEARDQISLLSAEDARREAERKYRDIFDNAVEGIFQTTPEGGFITVNPALARMLGYESAEELIRERRDIGLQGYVDPKGREEFRQLLETQDTVAQFEHQVYRRDRTKIWISENVRAVRDASGKLLYYEGTVEDITERKRAEVKSVAFGALARKLSGARVPLHAAQIIVNTADELFGWDSCTFDLYDPGDDLIHAILRIDTIEGSRSDVPPALDTRSPTTNGRYVIDLGARLTLREAPYKFDNEMLRFGDKNRPSASIMSVPIRHAAEVVGILSIQSYEPQFYNHNQLRDLQSLADYCGEALNRIWAEEKLRESEERLSLAVAAADLGIFEHDHISDAVYWSPTMRRIFGLHENEMSSLPSYLGLIHPEDRAEVAVAVERAHDPTGNGHFQVEHRIVFRDGRVRWVSLLSRTTFASLAIGLHPVRTIGIVADITERKRAEVKSVAFGALARKLSGARTALDAGRIIAATARDLFSWDSCNLDLYDAARNVVSPMLNVDTIDGKPMDVTPSISEREPTARTKSVIDHGPQLILRKEPVRFDEDAIPFGDTARPSASIMSVLISHKSKVIGLLSIQSYALRAYDDAALRDCQALADHCGVGLNRISAEEDLRESEERYRDLVENSRELICTHDLDGLILSANPAAAAAVGYDLDEYVGKKTVRDLLAPEVSDQFDEYMARLLKEGTTSGIMLVQTRSGERRVWEYYNSLRTEGVAAPIVRGMARDITERKQAENALQESEERFRQLSEAAFEAIILHDHGTILEVNQSFCRMYGYERAEVIGKSVLELTLPEFREPLRQRVQSGGAGSYDGLALRKDGTIFRAELAGKPIHYQGRAVRVAAIRDITEQKRNERRQVAQYAVTRVLAESATLAEATPQLLQVICESLRCKMGECWRKCDSTNFLRCVETWHTPALDATAFIEASRQTELAPGVGLAGRVWQNGQPAWIPDVMTDPRFARAEIAAKIGLRGAVAFPILLENHTLGVMQFFSRGIPEVDEDLLKILSAIGSQIGQFTERKRAEEALRQSEVYFRSLIEHAADTISTYDANGVRLYTSPSIERVLGYKPEEMIGRSGFELLHPDDRLLLASPGTKVTKELRCRHKDGTWRTLESTGSNLLGNPAVRAVVLNSRDITERRRAEESLQLFRNLIDQSNDAIEVIDPITLRFIDCNESAYRSLGYSREEFLALTVFDIDPVIDRSMIARLDEKMKGSGFATLESLHLRKDGTTFPVEVNVKIVRLERDYRLAVVRDITWRKQAEEALRKSEERYRELFENDKDAVYVHDLEGIYTSVNRAAETLSGYSRAQILGKHFRAFVSPEYLRQVGESFEKKLGEMGETNYEVEIINRAGARVPVEVSSRLIRENGVAVGVQGSVRDITERKRAQQALLTYSRRLLEAQEAERGRIARELHDQIGQMLTALKLNLHAIQSAREAGEARLLIEDNLKMIDEALEQVRDLSVDLRPLLLDDLGLVTALRWFVDQQAQRTGVGVEFTSDSLDPDLRFSSELEIACFRIAQEALTNIARHARAKAVTVRLSRSRDYLILLVEDDGVGFDMEALQGHAQASATLGLRGMQERAHAVGGRVKIDSTTNRGTQVFVELPIAMPNGRKPQLQTE